MSSIRLAVSRCQQSPRIAIREFGILDQDCEKVKESKMRARRWKVMDELQTARGLTVYAA